jgi:ATP-dependent exoDNAse (exonuclease V) beta subunit
VAGRRAWLYVSEATVVTLETNYRSTQSILDVTNRIIDLTPKPHAKELRSVKGSDPDRDFVLRWRRSACPNLLSADSISSDQEATYALIQLRTSDEVPTRTGRAATSIS